VNGINQSIIFNDSLFAPRLGISLFPVRSITATFSQILYRLDTKAPILQLHFLNSFSAFLVYFSESIQEWPSHSGSLRTSITKWWSKWLIAFQQSASIYQTGSSLPRTLLLMCCRKEETRHISPQYHQQISTHWYLVVSVVWAPAEAKRNGGAMYCASEMNAATTASRRLLPKDRRNHR
jgi:hypothetical protein